MANPNWGMLAKSQDDPETIEDAIARILAEHNDDEQAHLGEGRSLNSHAASEIIDHLAASIIADKLSSRSVGIGVFNIDKFYITPQIESLDAWYKSLDDSGGNVEIGGIGTITISCGPGVGKTTFANIYNYANQIKSSKNPSLQFRLVNDIAGYHDLEILCGYNADFLTSGQCFGIKYVDDDYKVYGIVRRYYSGSWHEATVYLGIHRPDNNLFLIQYNSTTNILSFYIDNLLIDTIDCSAHPLTIDASQIISAGIKNKSVYDTRIMNLSCISFSQDL